MLNIAHRDLVILGHKAKAKLHWPTFYRYRVANRGLRASRNAFRAEFGTAYLCAALVLGSHAYCVKWARGHLVKVPGTVGTVLEPGEYVLSQDLARRAAIRIFGCDPLTGEARDDGTPTA